MPTRRRDIALRLQSARTGTSALFSELPFLKSLLVSPTAAALAAELAGIFDIRLRDLDTDPASMDVDNGIIWLNTNGLNSLSVMRSRYFRKTVSLNFLCALRMGWQATRPHDVYDAHDPHLWPHIARAIAADTAAFTARMAHEIMIHDSDESLWRLALGEDIGDIASTYAAKGLLAAHDRWYTSAERLNQTDAALLDYMDKNILPPASPTLKPDLIIQNLTDPITNIPYLSTIPTTHDMPDPVNRAHFARILDDRHTLRVGEITLRDAALARRLMPAQ